MSQNSSLRGTTVLVTGASGFIGGRLAEHLTLAHGARVRALLHSCGRAVYLARLPVDLVVGDLLDADSLKRASDGCKVIFHCGYGASGEDGERRSVTLDGTESLLKLAHEKGVQRFVHMSTIAVNGPDPGATVDESSPYAYCDDVYSDAKIDAEKAAFHFAQKGLPLSVLRPTVVYGPRSVPWTVAPVSRMRDGTFTLIEGGTGVANHVYVDDVVQAAVLAATRPEAVGEAFVVSSGRSVPWKEFYGHYARMLGLDRMPSVSLRQIRDQEQHARRLRNPAFMALSFLASSHARGVVRQIPAIGQAYSLGARSLPGPAKQALLGEAEALRAAKLDPTPLTREWTVSYFSSRCVARIDKARRLLGFQPEFSLEEGMRLAEAWLRHVRLI